MTLLAASLSHAVITVSQVVAQHLLDAGIPAEKIHVVPNGVPLPALLPDRIDARSRLGISPDEFVVGTLARLVPEKGISDLISAIADLRDRKGSVRLVVAGDGPMRSALESQAEYALGGRATFLGRIPTTDDFYAATDVFALPSQEEGFGIVFIEAAFHGVPSIATQVGGVPEAIVANETGLLVPPGDRAGLVEGIRRLHDDVRLRRRLGDAARSRAYAKFTPTMMADGYLRVLVP